MSMDIWVPDAPRTKQRVECWYCDGIGKDPMDRQYTCSLCDGEKTIEKEISDAPEYNLSNSNGAMIMDLLGFDTEDNYAWTIPVEQLPEVRRRIIWLLNNPEALARGERAPSDTQAVRRERYKDPETGLDAIRTERGPRMIDFGIDVEYIKRRLNNMLEVVMWAQERGLEVVVG